MAKKLRLAHLTPTYFSADSIVGGGERYVHYLAKSLMSLNSENEFAQCIFTIGPQEALHHMDGVPIRILRNDSPRPGAMNYYSDSLWRELRDFDIVHLHQMLTHFGVYTLAIIKSLGIPVIGTDLGGGEDPLMLSRRGINLLDGVLSISEFAKSLTVNYYNRGEHLVMIGPVDTDFFTPSANVKRDRKSVVCVSRILPHKGIDRVIAALPPGLRLTVIGNVYHDEYYSLLQEMARDKDVVFMLNATDEQLVTMYRSSGLFIQASTALDIYGNFISKPELMGLTTLEAMSCGAPAVVSNAGSLPELTSDERFGKVFHNHDELVHIFELFRSGKWPDPDASALAREHVVRTHGMQAIGHALTRFYQRILEKRGKLIPCEY